MSDDTTQRDIGRLEARMEDLEDWAKAQSRQLDEMSTMLAIINNDLSAAKGASRAVIGMAMLAGGIVSWIATHFADRVLK